MMCEGCPRVEPHGALQLCDAGVVLFAAATDIVQHGGVHRLRQWIWVKVSCAAISRLALPLPED